MKIKKMTSIINRWWRFYNMYCYYGDMSRFMLFELTGTNDWWIDNYYRRLKKLKNNSYPIKTKQHEYN